ncbi:MAG: response regulator [Sandaracinaceae bacterium]
MAEPVQLVVVDDDLMLLRVTVRALQLNSIVTRAFDCPNAALTHVLEHPPDVVLTDYSMPRLTGGELSRAFRARLGAACPFIVLWTGARSRLSEADMNAADALLDKPCSIDRLARLIQRGARLHRRRCSGVQSLASSSRGRLDEDVG